MILCDSLMQGQSRGDSPGFVLLVALNSICLLENILHFCCVNLAENKPTCVLTLFTGVRGWMRLGLNSE